MTIRKRIDKIHGFYIEDLSVGMTDIYRKIVKNKDVTLFADISGDTNPLHLDKNFARSHKAPRTWIHICEPNPKIFSPC